MKRVAPGLVLAVLTLSAGLLGTWASVGGVAIAGGTSTPPSHVRTYYLTKGRFTGDQVLEACARGYHLASMYELENSGALAYNPKLGVRFEPYQWGPPFADELEEEHGWFDNGERAGRGENCNGWQPDPLCTGCYRGGTFGFKTGRRNADCLSESWRVWCISNP
jgi:hypothetical protein